MYIQDLAPYNYGLSKALPNVLAVGWLDKGYPFATGNAPADFIPKLKEVIAREDVNVMRGIHKCHFCDRDDFIKLDHDGQSIVLGHAEVWVPDSEGQLIFAAPSLIYHYVVEHHYLPPQTYIEAIRSFRVDSNWNGELICEQLTKSAYE